MTNFKIEPESGAQKRVINLFKDLGYDYLGDFHYQDNSPIIEDLLRKFLESRNIKDNYISAAIDKLRREASLNGRSLYEANQAVYKLLKYGITVRASAEENDQTIFPIDWQNPQANHFAIAEEVTIREGRERRPDLVIYINGIAIGVMELKRASVSVAEGISQLISNQSPEYNPGFFTTCQILSAANNSEGLRYGTIGTSAKYYLAWKEPGEYAGYLMDWHIQRIFQKERITEILRDFALFDAGVKKLPRPSQYFAIKAAQKSLAKKTGGIIWHSQGSGKSIIMVYLARWLLENNPEARVLIVTDRIELDTQIANVFRDAGEKRVKNIPFGKDLIPALQSPEHRLMCSLIHKFGSAAVRGEDSIKDFIKLSKDRQNIVPGDLIVLVDECHRSQGGNLYGAMRAALPNAIFIGFTGTPLLKKDRKTTMELFGGYIHTYKYDEAVEDKVVLNLLYEARDIDQRLGDASKIDLLFEKRTGPLNEWQKNEIKKHWASMEKLLSSKDRKQKIAGDIDLDFETAPFFKNGYGNAILVAQSIRDACQYYEIFENFSNVSPLKGKVGIVTSYNPETGRAYEDPGDGYETDRHYINNIYKRILKDVPKAAHKSPARVYEENIKKQFIKHPEKVKLLIVVDKLLTGFDAPSCTYIYLDKHLQDHGLFQAICRTNRLAQTGADWKNFGYIIDYKNLFKKVENAIAVYTSALDLPADTTDPNIIMKNRLTLLKENLEKARDAFKAIMEPIPELKTELEIIRYFCGNTENADDLEARKPLRELLYNAVVKFVRAHALIAEEMEEAGYMGEEIGIIKKEVGEAVEIRQIVRNTSGETLDLKPYEADMRDLLDRYVQADESKKISQFGNQTLLDLISKTGIKEAIKIKFGKLYEMAQQEGVENNIRRALNDAHSENPILSEKLSELLNELIAQRKARAIEYEEYLKKLLDLIINPLINPDNSQWPKSCDTQAKRSLYDNLDHNEDLALAIYGELIANCPADWRKNISKQREVQGLIYKHLPDVKEVERIFPLIINLQEF